MGCPKLKENFTFLKALHSKKGESLKKNDLDYYSYGMPMPNRNIEGQYRYAYQGQEKDPETGMEAFELRLWDARIGRWLTTDPYGQYFSPYLGMGNNPISRIDPDGGCDDPPCDVDGGALPEIVITASSGGGGGFDFGGMPDFMRFDSSSWTSPYTGTLDQYNTEFGTDYTNDQGNGTAHSQWAYQNYYKPQYDDMISSMHATRNKAAEYIMYVLPTPLVGAAIVSKSIPLLARGGKALGKGYGLVDDGIAVIFHQGNRNLHQLKRFGINKLYNFYTGLPRIIRKGLYPLQKGLNKEQNIFRNYLNPNLPKRLSNLYDNISNFF